ncbi:hypothetical protein TEA_026263 [Camellia sinensis var. sinensis]|uniref:Terpene synthase metal-binding domain-containing protein n=1 Tax=Camellia sinensis var. sinensis TaxID=542762 RepID=A0A4S4DF48_CAMSN|nr:hypothetical protein TEA_026263 [Camellia sinensis var. sinensis]
MMLTKVIALTSIIDDIYDVYGTLEELALFANAIERFKPIHSLMNFAFDLIEVSKSLQLFIIYLYFKWEINAIDQLLEYMKPRYQALLDVYNMIDEEMARKGRSYRIHYAKSTVCLVLIGYKQMIYD